MMVVVEMRGASRVEEVESKNDEVGRWVRTRVQGMKLRLRAR
jgi:hypothetical protein